MQGYVETVGVWFIQWVAYVQFSVALFNYSSCELTSLRGVQRVAVRLGTVLKKRRDLPLLVNIATTDALLCTWASQCTFLRKNRHALLGLVAAHAEHSNIM